MIKLLMQAEVFIPSFTKMKEAGYKLDKDFNLIKI